MARITTMVQQSGMSRDECLSILQEEGFGDAYSGPLVTLSGKITFDVTKDLLRFAILSDRVISNSNIFKVEMIVDMPLEELIDIAKKVHGNIMIKPLTGVIRIETTKEFIKFAIKLDRWARYQQ